MGDKSNTNPPSPEQEPDIADFTFTDEEPAPLNLEEVREMIGYPKVAKEHGMEGTLVIRVLINKEGDAVKFRTIIKVHPLFQEAVEAHVLKLKFSPAMKDGKPLMFWMNIPFRFKIQS